MHTLLARLPDGCIVTRKTERDYRFAVCGLGVGRWRVYRWTTLDKDRLPAIVREIERYHAVSCIEIVAVYAQPKPARNKQSSHRPKLPKKPADRCTKCGAPCSRHFTLCYHCRGGDDSIGLKTRPENPTQTG